ncbi:MAG: hypothetical protein ACKOD2_12385, partial [Ilumatobacteraceae bacterium]
MEEMFRRLLLCLCLLGAVGIVGRVGVDSAGAIGDPLEFDLDLDLDVDPADGELLVELPLNGLGYAQVDWNVGGADPVGCVSNFGALGGEVELGDIDISCDFEGFTGDVTVSVDGVIPRLGRDEPVDGAEVFVGVADWGDVGTNSLEGAFEG